MHTGDQIALTLGKKHWPFGQYQIALDQLFTPHLLVVGQTGAGKSTTLKEVSHELSRQKVGQIIFDPTGEFIDYEQPQVKYVLGDNVFFDLSQLDAKSLIAAFGLESNETLVERLNHAQIALKIARYRFKTDDKILDTKKLSTDDFYNFKAKLYASQNTYNLSLLGKQLLTDLEADYLANRISSAEKNEFNQFIIKIVDRLTDPRLKAIAPNKTSGQTKYDLIYLLKLAADKANFGSKIAINLAKLKDLGQLQATIMSVAWQRLLAFQSQSSRKKPVFLFIDEGHRFVLPNDDKSSGLAQILREGRKEKLFVAFATQSPLDLPNSLNGQFSALIAHRLVQPAEWRQLPLIWPTKRLTKQISRLKTGQALVKTTNQKQTFIQVNHS